MTIPILFRLLAIIILFAILPFAGLSLWHFARIKFILRFGIRSDGHVVKKRYDTRTNRTGGVTVIPIVMFLYFHENKLKVTEQRVSKSHFEHLKEESTVAISYLNNKPNIAILSGSDVDYAESLVYLGYTVLIGSAVGIFALIIALILPSR